MHPSPFNVYYSLTQDPAFVKDRDAENADAGRGGLDFTGPSYYEIFVDSEQQRRTVMTGEPLTGEEIRIAREVQGDLPLCRRPFAEIAARIDLPETAVIDGVQRLLARRVARKFGAIVRHRRAGYVCNALVVWAVPPSRIEETGQTLAGVPAISHCYERRPPLAGRYNLFSMMHFKDPAIEPEVRKLAAEIGLTDYRVFDSIEELKKTSMEYFA